jgi:hypothetical protein
MKYQTIIKEIAGNKVINKRKVIVNHMGMMKMKNMKKVKVIQVHKCN